jgi:hypothetical protein
MAEPIIYVDHSEIRDGQFEELKMAMIELAQFVKANEPQLLVYNVYFSEDRACSCKTLVAWPRRSQTSGHATRFDLEERWFVTSKYELSEAGKSKGKALRMYTVTDKVAVVKAKLKKGLE